MTYCGQKTHNDKVNRFLEIFTKTYIKKSKAEIKCATSEEVRIHSELENCLHLQHLKAVEFQRPILNIAFVVISVSL